MSLSMADSSVEPAWLQGAGLQGPGLRDARALVLRPGDAWLIEGPVGGLRDLAELLRKSTDWHGLSPKNLQRAWVGDPPAGWRAHWQRWTWLRGVQIPAAWEPVPPPDRRAALSAAAALNRGLPLLVFDRIAESLDPEFAGRLAADLRQRVDRSGLTVLTLSSDVPEAWPLADWRLRWQAGVLVRQFDSMLSENESDPGGPAAQG